MLLVMGVLEIRAGVALYVDPRPGRMTEAPLVGHLSDVVAPSDTLSKFPDILHPP